MHDLQTIRRLNAEAHAKSIKTAQDAGMYVVATYAGLALMSTQRFDNIADATRAQLAPTASPDEHRKLFSPTPADQVVGSRDQSEDRAVAHDGEMP